MPKILSIVLVLFFTGLFLGYGGHYLHFRNERNFGAEYSKYEYELPSLTCIPGILIQDKIYGLDYRLTESWLLHKHHVAIYNALSWTAFGICIITPLTLLRRRHNKSLEPTSSSKLPAVGSL